MFERQLTVRRRVQVQQQVLRLLHGIWNPLFRRRDVTLKRRPRARPVTASRRQWRVLIEHRLLEIDGMIGQVFFEFG